MSGDGDEKGKEDNTNPNLPYHKLQRNVKSDFLLRKKNYLEFTRLDEIEKASISLFLNTRVDRYDFRCIMTFSYV